MSIHALTVLVLRVAKEEEESSAETLRKPIMEEVLRLFKNDGILCAL